MAMDTPAQLGYWAAISKGALVFTRAAFVSCLLVASAAGGVHAETHALSFDGESDYVEAPEPTACIPGASSFTIEFWAQTSPQATGWNLPFEWPGGHRIYVGHQIGAGWNFVVASDGVRTDTNAGGWIADITGRWLFVQAVLARDPDSQTLRVYDAEDDRWHEASVTPAPGETRPAGPLYIPSPPDKFPFNGMMREVRFWRTVRSTEDAERDMYETLNGAEDGLAGYWVFDEGETVRDRTPHGAHGEIVGGEWTPLSFVCDLADVIAGEGRPVTLGPVRLWGGGRAFSYTWRLNGVEIPGAVGVPDSAYRIDQATAAHEGLYDVVVTDAETGVVYTSAEATLRIGTEDWPMWQYDAARSAASPVELAEDLHLQWVRELPPPKRAWPHQWDHRGKLDFDLSYAPVVKDGRVFVPSNVTDSVTAYSATDGAELWRAYADGPVRLAPVAWEDRVFFISDDGRLYCVDAATGAEIWRFQGGPSDHRLLGNERIISFWAARGAPVVYDGIVYFAAGVWPMHGVFIYALDAATGEVVWVNDTTGAEYVDLPHPGADALGSIAPQGYIAASEDRLVVAGGRTPPAYLNRRTGEIEEMALRANPDGGYAVHADGTGAARNVTIEERLKDLADQLDAEPFNALAARDRLFVTTESGTVYCFGPKPTEPVRHTYHPGSLTPRSDRWTERARQIVDDLGEREGYALLLGAGSGDLLRELLLSSDLHVVLVEADAEKARALRDELVAAGLYGRRAAVIQAEPATFAVQPYLFSIVASENVAAAGIEPDQAILAHLLDRLRPYGGVAYLGSRPRRLAALCEAAAAAQVDQVQVTQGERALLARRGGPLTGAGQWTHQYADGSNTNFSPDLRTKAPLGILWFGGPSNENVLPRHGHGPLPQVVGGRLIVPGLEGISARCVYTGRHLWEATFPGLGHPFTDLELEERWGNGHMVFMHSANGVGANQLGSPYVSLADGIYVRYKTRVFRLDPTSGEVVSSFALPVADELRDKPDWGHLSITGDLIITTVEPQTFEAAHYTEAFQTMQDLKTLGWEATSSERLVAMDRNTGDVLWTRDAQVGFRHNAIVSGGARLYIIDGLSDAALDRLQRRGEPTGQAALLALDPRTGDELWSRDTDIFGTWLGYSESRDILIQGGRPGGLRPLEDEPGDRIAAYQGISGDPLWDSTLPPYWGPLAIRHDTIYLPPAASSGSGRALSLLTGEQIMRAQPLTGETAPWSYTRRYGCNSHNVSEYLITFRSGAAAYFDLEHDSGTGAFGGFRSGCTNNMIVGDGVLNAPDYTRSCTCSYQHQTSLALIHMPDMPSIEAWTCYDAAPPDPKGYGINLGAPGRRVDHASGRIWHEREGTLRRHQSAIVESGGGIDWVLSSALEVDGEHAGAIEIYDLLQTRYTVRLHLAELDADARPGERVFDVLIDGEPVLRDVDIAARAGGAMRGIVEEFTVDSGMTMRIALRRAEGARRPPLINGIELIANDMTLAAAGR